MPPVRRAATTARQEKAAAATVAKDARKDARKPGQTPSEVKKSKETSATADKKLEAATGKSKAADAKLQEAEEKAALTATRAEEAMRKANALALAECKAPPYSQKDIDKVKPTKNELDSAFEGTSRKAELEKVLGLTPPPQRKAARKPEKGEAPPKSLDAVDARVAKAAANTPNGNMYTDPSTGAKYQVKQNATTGETVLSDTTRGTTVTVKPDGSYTSTVTSTESTKSGGTRETTWTKSSDAQGKPTRLESRTSQTEQHPETGATTTTSTTQYDATRSPPGPRSRTEEVLMEKPPAALEQRRGTPQGPATVKTETQFNAQGLPTKQVKTTEIHTPGFKAHDVSAFEAGQDSALRNASKGEDHHRTNNAPTPLKPGESSLTLTEETRFNAQGEPAVSTRKTELVATQALKSDKNGNGVQVVRTQQEVTRGPKDSVSIDTAPALTPKTPGAVNQRTTVTGYDPDGSHFEAGHARRSRTVTQSSGTVDAHGQMQLKHQPTQVQSLHEASDNRWRYDHVGFDVGADGKPVPGQEPRQLDKERQLNWYEDATEFVGDELKALADTVDDIADAASDFVTAPLQEALTDEIQKLDSAGDSVSLSGNLDVKVGLKGGISGEAAIERTEDGKYQLSAEVTADVGVGLLGSASVGAGGRMEWMFNTPEEAAKAALTLGKGPSALAPGSEGHTFLREHLSAMEVNVTGEVEAGIGGGIGTGTAELSASLGATGSLRVEFDKGKPTHLVKSVSFEGSGAAGAATGLKGKADLSLGGEVSGSVSIETKTPLDASKLDGNDVLSFLTGDKSDALVGPSETSITVEGSVDRGNQGQYFTAEVSGLTDKEVQSVTDKLKAGKFENAFDDLRKEAKVTQGSFKDRELGVGAKLGVVDFELSARHRDVTAEGGGGGGNGSTTVSLGGGKRRGGSDGPSGSHGSTGGPNRSTGNEATGGTGPSTKKPGNTSTDRDLPTQYRVNPATGHFTPVPLQDGGPSRADQSDKPGTLRSSAESRPPSTEKRTLAYVDVPTSPKVGSKVNDGVKDAPVEPRAAGEGGAGKPPPSRPAGISEPGDTQPDFIPLSPKSTRPNGVPATPKDTRPDGVTPRNEPTRPEGVTRSKTQDEIIDDGVRALEVGDFDMNAPGQLYHSSSSSALDGIEAAGGLLPATQLKAKDITRKSGEGPQYSRTSTEKNFISFGKGPDGLGTAHAYSDLYEQSSRYNPSILTPEELSTQITKYQDLLSRKLLEIDPLPPVLASNSKAATRLRQLKAEQALRGSLPEDDRPRPYPMLFEFDGAQIPSQPHGNLPGEVKVLQKAGLENLKRIFVPADKVAEVQARMDRMLGREPQVQVIPLESLEQVIPSDSSPADNRKSTRERMLLNEKKIEEYYDDRLEKFPPN
ncbi:hypothetical protein D7V80_03305 [Corallococcus sp. CA054B]|nr:hypothetical protein D7V80_03305 [Corallococcus sp. CA054B]